jgi:hypothetical protein
MSFAHGRSWSDTRVWLAAAFWSERDSEEPGGT